MKFTDKNNITKDLNFKLKIYTNPIKLFSVNPCSDDPNGCLNIPGKINKKIDVKKCQFSTANTKVKIFNFDCETSKWFYSKLNSVTDNIYNKKCQIIASFDEVEKVMFTGYFRNFNNDIYETYYEFEIANLKEKLKESIFDSQLSEKTVFQTRKLNEVFIQDTIEKDDETVKRIIFNGHPLILCKAVFSMLFEDEYENVVDFEAFDETKLPFKNVYFEWYEALDNPGDFLEEQIYRLINKYPVITEDGKITLISQELPSIEEIDIEDIILKEEDIKEIKSNKSDLSMLLNNIKCSSKYDFYEDEYKTVYYLPNERSFKKHGNELFPKTPYSLEFQGINIPPTDQKTDKSFSLSDKTTLLSSVTNTLYSRYADLTKTYKIECFFSDMDKYHIGKYLILESKDLIDNETGKRGLIPTFSDNSKAYIDTDVWADYRGKSSNDNLGYLNNIKVVEVGNVISLDFFNSIINNHNNMNNFLTESDI